MVSLGGRSNSIAHLRAAQPVALFASFDQAGFGVGVATRPARMCRVAAAVLHLQKVANGVVYVALDVRAHGIPVVGGETPGSIGAKQAHAASIIMRVRDGCTSL